LKGGQFDEETDEGRERRVLMLFMVPTEGVIYALDNQKIIGAELSSVSRSMYPPRT
jgi:hypothetical protein